MATHDVYPNIPYLASSHSVPPDNGYGGVELDIGSGR